MRKLKGLTRIDCVILMAAVVLLGINFQAFCGLGRERTKKEVCMSNLRLLAAAWQNYSNDNSGKIPSGDIGYSWTFPTSSGGPQLAWVEFPHPLHPSIPPNVTTNWNNKLSYTGALSAGIEIWQHAISEGTLWKWVGDYDIYRCRSAAGSNLVTYSMSQSMNTYPGAAGNGAVTLTNRNQITKPAERFVFLDCGFAKMGAFYINYNSGNGGAPPGTWADSPPKLHNMGTTFVFADGHALYRKWTDPHTLSAGPGWGAGPIDYCDCDLRWMEKVTWGSVPFTCGDPAKNCEY